MTEQLAVGQALLHETVEVYREAKGLSKGGKIARFLRIAARILRVVTKSRLFAKVHHRRTKKGVESFHVRIQRTSHGFIIPSRQFFNPLEVSKKVYRTKLNSVLVSNTDATALP